MPKTSNTSAPPTGAKAFSRLAAESVSAEQTSLRTDPVARIDTLGLGQIGKMKRKAAHADESTRSAATSQSSPVARPMDRSCRRRPKPHADAEHLALRAQTWPWPDAHQAEKKCDKGRRDQMPMQGNERPHDSSPYKRDRPPSADRRPAASSRRLSASIPRSDRAKLRRTHRAIRRGRICAVYPCRDRDFSPLCRIVERVGVYARKLVTMPGHGLGERERFLFPLALNLRDMGARATGSGSGKDMSTPLSSLGLVAPRYLLTSCAFITLRVGVTGARPVRSPTVPAR